MSYELLQQGPGAFLPILFFSIIITILGYGAFPFIFSRSRKIPITKKKFRWLCYGINFAVMFLFIVFNGEANGGPYLLWTWLFSRNGIKVLEERDLLKDSDYIETPQPTQIDQICFCRKCGEKLLEDSRFCRKCGTEIVEE